MADALRMLIGDDWVDAETGATFDAFSPSTGEVIATLPEGTRVDAARAIDAANEVAPGRAARSAFEPLRAEARDEVEELIAYFDMAAAYAVRADLLMPPSVDPSKRVLLQRVPQRVVGAISPWNSGVGRVGGRFSMDRLTELKTIVVDLG